MFSLIKSVDDDDDEFKFNDASTHKGHLRQNGEKTVNNQLVYKVKILYCSYDVSSQYSLKDKC